LKPLSHAAQAVAFTYLPAHPVVINGEMNCPVFFKECYVGGGCVSMADDVRDGLAQSKAKNVDLARGKIHRGEHRGQFDVGGKQASPGAIKFGVQAFDAIAGYGFPNLGEGIASSLLGFHDLAPGAV